MLRLLTYVLTCGALASVLEADERIDRRALADRHSPTITAADPLAPLSVGNGKFAFTADVTGLQSFPNFYADGIPLATQSEWGWHAFPNPSGHRLDDALAEYDSHGRPVPYASLAETNAGKWLRANPHRLGLGKIGFEFTRTDGGLAQLEHLSDVEQKLDLWTGTLISKYRVDGTPVEVRTGCHPARDAISVRVTSPLLDMGRLKIVIRFGYGSGEFGKDPDDFTRPDAHSTRIVTQTDSTAQLARQLDEDSYIVRLAFSPGSKLIDSERHRFELMPRRSSKPFELVAEFAQELHDASLPSADEVAAKSEKQWAEFWQSGGAIDLSRSSDQRARELERRIVLSQYLLAIQCAGTRPPQETGLTFNSWFGKSHLEMHWWHGVHFALWNRLEMLERSLAWYHTILPRARETARLQGYAGARWPKMVGPDGRESPSTAGVFLIWQQPHPIYYAELCYRARPDRETLDKYAEIVFVTADFMATYASWDDENNRYVLGPPLIPAQEHYDARTTLNPTFELQYWRWALETAQLWKDRLGLEPDQKWRQVQERLASLPIKDGVYETAEGLWVNTDHPSHLAALGFLPGKSVDRPAMQRTLDRVLENWDWQRTWGWDYPLVAMTAARLGDGEAAIDALLMDVPKNLYLANGHNHQDDRLPIYLPGNGALLTAAAMMAAGWDDAPDLPAPGFPRDGSWTVRWEGLRPMP